MTWDTRATTLDPGLTAITLRARHEQAGHYVAVREWERRRQRRRVLEALAGGLVLIAVVGLVGWAVYCVGGLVHG